VALIPLGRYAIEYGVPGCSDPGAATEERSGLYTWYGAHAQWSITLSRETPVQWRRTTSSGLAMHVDGTTVRVLSRQTEAQAQDRRPVVLLSLYPHPKNCSSGSAWP
jgi:hypothetical protein